jgi:hypothetical protein
MRIQLSLCALLITTGGVITAVGCGSSDDGSTAASAGPTSTSSSGMGGGTGGGGTGGSSSSGFQPAPHGDAPQEVSLGGKVMKAPKVLAIAYDMDPFANTLDEFVQQLAKSTYFPAATAEYGVGPLTALPIVRIPGALPKTVDESTLLQMLDDNLTAGAPGWGKADQETIYIFVPPASTTVTGGGDTCCTAFDGYHAETKAGGKNVAYSLVCQCGGVPGVSATDYTTTTISHEVVEAATDPLTNSSPAWGFTDDAHFAWTLLTDGEVSDLCEFDLDQYLKAKDITHSVQRSWSNAAAKAGKDPCVPTQGAVYFNSVPVLDEDVTMSYYGQKVQSKGVKIPVGQSKTIDVQLFSEAPTSGKWQVAAYDYGALYGVNSTLDFTWDKTSGENGDVLKLTIKAKGKVNQFGGTPFMVESTLGDQDNIWIGFVAN